ncbi:MAG TPA: gas vesicle protein GvpN [Spirochaetia bacterium]|nr:gas vesicle protein GvpN [Spirochaetia bacterium]
MTDKPNVEKSEQFVQTKYLRDVAHRALQYLDSGLCVHFSGPSGVGKTSMAMLVAKNLERPYSVIYGNNDYTTSDLIGGNFGYRRKKKVDNFIHNVYTMEEDFQLKWLDKQLTTACREGHVLIYDEFSRTRPEINNIFLSVLEEGTLFLPSFESTDPYVKVHPDFRLIFTSNPAEYAGVHKTQVALEDRMVTIQLSGMDRETEIAVTVAHSGIDDERARKIVGLVWDFRDTLANDSCSVRTCIKIGKVLSLTSNRPASDIPIDDIFLDILLSEFRHKEVNKEYMEQKIKSLVNSYFPQKV